VIKIVFLVQMNEQYICHVSALIVLRRSDKRADRVEISPEQLSAASNHVDVCFPCYISFSDLG